MVAECFTEQYCISFKIACYHDSDSRIPSISSINRILRNSGMLTGNTRSSLPSQNPYVDGLLGKVHQRKMDVSSSPSSNQPSIIDLSDDMNGCVSSYGESNLYQGRSFDSVSGFGKHDKRFDMRKNCKQGKVHNNLLPTSLTLPHGTYICKKSKVKSFTIDELLKPDEKNNSA